MPGRKHAGREAGLSEIKEGMVLLAKWVYGQLVGALTHPAGGSGIVEEITETGYNVASAEADQRAKIVASMRSKLGKKYLLGVEVKPGQDSDTWDCSEAVEDAYRDAGLTIPDGARFQYEACQPVKNPKPGDLFFLWSDKRGMIGHVMVLTDLETVVHAVGGRGVVEDPVSMWEHHERGRGWRRHVDFARPSEDRA